MLYRSTLSKKFFANELSLFLKEVRFKRQEFFADKLILNIKYHYSDSQNNNLFYSFNNQLNYAPANYFAESKIKNNNVNKFLFNLLIALFIKKLSY